MAQGQGAISNSFEVAMKSGAQNFVQLEKNEGFEGQNYCKETDSIDSAEHHNVISIEYEAMEWQETLIGFSK